MTGQQKAKRLKAFGEEFFKSYDPALIDGITSDNFRSKWVHSLVGMPMGDPCCEVLISCAQI